MPDYYLIHNADEGLILREKIMPLFKQAGVKIERVQLSKTEKLNRIKEGSKCLVFLKDQDLKAFLKPALEKKWVIGFLPHPEMRHGRSGFGVAQRYDRAVEDILKAEKPAVVDMMFCNDIPVLNAVTIGRGFSFFMPDPSEETWWGRIRSVFSQMSSLSKTRHQAFHIETQKNNIIHTSAMGIVAFEHGRSTVFSRRVIEDSSASDGMLHALIIAPRSILSMVWYFLCAFFGIDRFQKSFPDFVGHIKTEKLTITSQDSIDFIHDGVLIVAKSLSLDVSKRVLTVFPGRYLDTQGVSDQTKESFKIKALPRGEAVQEFTSYPLPWFYHSAPEEFRDLFMVLRESAQTSQAYMVLMILATLMAMLGLFANSPPVVIGAMVLAPLMAPITALSMGVLRQDQRLLSESVKSIMTGLALCLGFAVLASWLIPLHELNNEIAMRTRPNLLDMGVAVVSGIAGAYAHARAEAAKSLAGVAIAVALVPPLCVAGIGLSWLELNIFWGAFLLFLTNLAGITLAAAATFMILGYSPFHRAQKGLALNLAVVIVICLPLAFSFMRMVDESHIVRSVSRIEWQNTSVRNVAILQYDPLLLSATLVSSGVDIDQEKIDFVKRRIEEELDRPVKLQATLAYER